MPNLPSVRRSSVRVLACALVAGFAGLWGVGSSGVASARSVAGSPGDAPLRSPANSPRRDDVAWHAITNATVHTRPGETLERATIVVRDGVIERVLRAQPGADGAFGTPDDVLPEAPAGASVMDCTGLHVYAALIDAFVEVDAPAPDRAQPASHWNDKVVPDRSALASGGVSEAQAEGLRKLGFGAALIAPKGGVVRGSGAVVSLGKKPATRAEPRARVYTSRAYQFLSLQPEPGDPSNRGDAESWSAYPAAQMGAIAVIRQVFLDAAWLERRAERAAGSRELQGGQADGAPNAETRDGATRRMNPLAAPETALSALIPQSSLGTPASGVCFLTENELEVIRAAKLVREIQGLSPDAAKPPALIIGSGTEYQRLAAIRERLSSRGTGQTPIALVLPLAFPRAPDVSSVGKAEGVELRDLMAWEQAPTNPRRVVEAGLDAALTTSRLPRGQKFEDNLARALSAGLEPEQALAMLTTIPARLLGVEDRLGTIEAGKIANLLVVEGELFRAPESADERRQNGRAGDDAEAQAMTEAAKAARAPGAANPEGGKPGTGQSETKTPASTPEGNPEGKPASAPTGQQTQAGKAGPGKVDPAAPTQPERAPDPVDVAKDPAPGEQKDQELNENRPDENRPETKAPDEDSPRDVKPGEEKPDDERSGAASKAASREKPRVLDVWIDGVRHAINPPKPTSLEGQWVLALPGRAMLLSFDRENKATLRAGGKNVRPTKSGFEQGLLSLVVEGGKLGLDKGFHTFSGVLTARDGSKGAQLPRAGNVRGQRLSGEGLLPSGERFAWSAERAGKHPLEGTWRVVEADGKERDAAAADGLTIKLSATSLELRFTQGGASPAAPTVITSDDVDLVWASDAATGKPKPEGTFTHELAKLGGKGVSRDSIRLDAETGLLVGVSTLPDGSKHEYKARRELEATGTGEATRAGRQDGQGAGPSGAKAGAQKSASASAKKAPLPALAVPFGPYGVSSFPELEHAIITNATLWTCGPAGVIENGEIETRDGRIVYVGSVRPRAAVNGATGSVKIIDAAGKHVTPGVIDCHSHTGISGGVNDAGQAVTSEVRIQDVTNPDSISWYRQLAAGVTAVNSLHGSANAIGGQNAVNKVRWGAPDPDDFHFAGGATYSDANPFAPGAPAAKGRFAPGIKFALGENVKQSNSGERSVTRYPQTRMGVEAIIRDRFTAAREYRAEWKAYADKVGAILRLRVAPAEQVRRIAALEEPRRDLELEALAEVLEGVRLVHCHSYRQDEVLMMARLAQEFGFKLGTYQHILEGYKVADAVRDSAIGASAFSDWWAFKVEVQDAIPYAGTIMHDVGVLVSFNSDSDELARRLNTEAAKATKYGGLPPAEAIKFVTLNPAKQLKIDAWVGSLEEGKQADLAIWSAQPMSSFARCEATYVDGRLLFSLEKDREHRAKIARERARLIQLILAERDPASASGGSQAEGATAPTEGEGTRRRRRPGAEQLSDWFHRWGMAATSGADWRDEGASDDDGHEHGHAHGRSEHFCDPRSHNLSREDRQRYLELYKRGINPDMHRPGECGCEGSHHDE
ncbi:MAG: amidohydrolase family protein [Planctomycetota bacterium]|nr:amidohydrolase family protein [Planctomycetota bacterium]